MVQAAGDHKEVDDAVKDEVIEAKLPEGSYCMQYMSVTCLQHIASNLEDVSCSVYMLRKLVERGNRDANKVKLLELIEYMTGNKAMWKHGCTTHEELLDILQPLNEERGRRAALLKLPPKWPKDGPYEVYDKDSKTYIRHKYLSDSQFNECLLSGRWIPSKATAKSLSLLDNFSDTKAVLMFPGCSDEGILCTRRPKRISRRT